MNKTKAKVSTMVYFVDNPPSGMSPNEVFVYSVASPIPALPMPLDVRYLTRATPELFTFEGTQVVIGKGIFARKEGDDFIPYIVAYRDKTAEISKQAMDMPTVAPLVNAMNTWLLGRGFKISAVDNMKLGYIPELPKFSNIKEQRDFLDKLLDQSIEDL